MKKTLNGNEAIELLNRVQGRDFETVRAMVEAYDIRPGTVVLREAWLDVLDIVELCYNPADFGKEGKHKEAVHRVYEWLETSRPWARWSEFFARKSGKTDIGSSRMIEMKTGAGDWLYSARYSDFDSIIAEYSEKDTVIVWETDEFVINTTWRRLFEYLIAYNPKKGLDTWFRRDNMKYNVTLSKTVICMQSFKNSAKKIAYLQAFKG